LQRRLFGELSRQTQSSVLPDGIVHRHRYKVEKVASMTSADKFYSPLARPLIGSKV
jgi:hypothetical protein